MILSFTSLQSFASQTCLELAATFLWAYYQLVYFVVDILALIVLCFHAYLD